MSSADVTIVEIEDGEAPAPTGRERRRAVATIFVIALAVGSALVGRDGPAATAPTAQSTEAVTHVYSGDGRTLILVSHEDVRRVGSGVVLPDPGTVRVQLPEGAIFFVQRPSTSDLPSFRVSR